MQSKTSKAHTEDDVDFEYWDPTNSISDLNIHKSSFWLKLLQPRILTDASIKNFQAKKITGLLQENSSAAREKGPKAGKGSK